MSSRTRWSRTAATAVTSPRDSTSCSPTGRARSGLYEHLENSSVEASPRRNGPAFGYGASGASPQVKEPARNGNTPPAFNAQFTPNDGKHDMWTRELRLMKQQAEAEQIMKKYGPALTFVELLARARLAEDAHRDVDGRDVLDPTDERALGTLADDPVERQKV